MPTSRQRLADALRDFKRVADELENAWNCVDDDESFYAPCDGYPFDKSFEEVNFDIGTWVLTAVESLNEIK